MTWFSSGARQWMGTPTPTQPPSSPQQIGMQNSLNASMGWNAPALLQNEANASRLAGQLGYADANYGLQQNFLNENAGLDRQRLGLSANNLGVDRDSINRQIGVQGQLQELANQLFGVGGQKIDLTQQGLEADYRSRGHDLKQQLFDLMSQATTKGSVGSVANKLGLQNNKNKQIGSYADLVRGLQGLDLNRSELGINKEQSDVNFTENKAKLADRLKTLDNESAKLGIDRKQLETNLQQGMAKLGLDRLMTVDSLIDAMQSNDIEKQAIAQNIFREAIGMSQFFIDQVPFQGGGGGTFSGHAGASGSW
jgi:hypothetical protein